MAGKEISFEVRARQVRPGGEGFRLRDGFGHGMPMREVKTRWVHFATLPVGVDDDKVFEWREVEKAPPSDVAEAEKLRTEALRWRELTGNTMSASKLIPYYKANRKALLEQARTQAKVLEGKLEAEKAAKARPPKNPAPAGGNTAGAAS